MAALVAQQDRLMVSGKANLIAAWFVVDRSGSMAGQRWSLTQAGVRSCLAQLTGSDFVGLLAFNSKVEMVAMGRKEGLNVAPFFAMTPSGGTALYDAIALTLREAIPTHLALTKMTQEAGVSSQLGVISYVVVLTDGEDNESSVSLSATMELLATVNRLTNFKVVLAGVGLSGAAQTSMSRLGSVGDDDIEFRNLRSDADIKDLFEHISIQLSVQRTTLVVPLTGGSSAASSSAPARLQLMPPSSSSSSSSASSGGRIQLIERHSLQWQPDSAHRNCKFCRATFTFALRRHHCRMCGYIFCYKHCQKVPLRKDLSVRICPPCLVSLVS